MVRRTGHAALGALVVAIASLWLAVAIRGVLTGDPAIVPGLENSGAYWAGAVGMALAVLGLYWTLRRQAVAIDRGALVVTERSLFGGHTWCEPLASYPEIRGRTEQRPHRYGRRSWYVVEIWHPEPGKRVELARGRDPAAIETRAQACARCLRLPLVWEQQPRSAGLDQVGAYAADRPGRGGSRSEVAAASVAGQSLSAP